MSASERAARAERAGRAERAERTPDRPPRRRADAERSRAAVLDAAVRLLARSPDAGMAAIAREAGVTRQTVYAHYGSRDALLLAMVERVTEETVAALDAVELEEGPALDALLRFLDISWNAYEAHPALALGKNLPVPPERDEALHEPVFDRLTRLLERGRKAGEFDPGMSPAWMVRALAALGHAAGEEVAEGRMRVEEAREALRSAAVRLLAPAPREGPAAPEDPGGPAGPDAAGGSDAPGRPDAPGGSGVPGGA